MQMSYNQINWLDRKQAEEYLKDNPLPVQHIKQKYSRKKEGFIPIYVEPKINDKGKLTGRKLYYASLVKLFQQTTNFKIVGINEKKDYYIWDGNKYVEYDIGEIGIFLREHVLQEGDIEGFSATELNTFRLNLVSTTKVQSFSDLVKSRLYYFAFKNGILDVRDLSFGDFRPEVFITDRLPYRYNTDSEDMPNWDRLMNIVFGSERDGLEYRELFEFYLGYTLSMDNTTNFQYFMILQGGGSNGKSFVLDVIKKMIGSHNYTNKKLKDMLDGELGAEAELEDKLALIDDDEHTDVFAKSTALLKELTGGNESMTVRKMHVGNKRIDCRAKVWIAMNPLPFSSDTSDGFRRRLLILPFLKKINKQTAIRDDGSKSMFVPEFPAIIRRCLGIYHRALEARQVHIPSAVEELRDRIFRKSDNLGMWLEDSLIYTGDSKDKLNMQHMYDLYSHMYNTSKRWSKQKQSFYEEVRVFVDKISVDYKNKVGVFTGKACDTSFEGKVYNGSSNFRFDSYIDYHDEIILSDKSIPLAEIKYDYSRITEIKSTKMSRSRNVLQGFLFKSEVEMLKEDIISF